MKLITILLLLCLPVCAYSLEINSSSFEGGGRISLKYACDGENISPALAWSQVPAGTKSFALICSDPDAPSKAWTHWVVFNIPADKRGFEENVPKYAKLGDGSIQGVNDFGKAGYGGPCPPPGVPHRYYFRIYCLDSRLSLEEGATKDQVLNVAKEHIIGAAEIYGVYNR